MRRRLSTLVSNDRAVVNHSGSRGNACAHHETSVDFLKEGGPEKKNPAVGTPGQIFLLSEFTVSSMRPGCCSLRPRARSGLLLLSSQLSVLVLLLSCFSLTFRNLTEPFANSHRFLSVAHSLVPGWGRPILSKTHAQGLKTYIKQQHPEAWAPTDSVFSRESVKTVDRRVSAACSCFSGVA